MLILKSGVFVIKKTNKQTNNNKKQKQTNKQTKIRSCTNVCLHPDDIDVFCGTETWLHDDFDNDVQNDGYNVFWLDMLNMEHRGIVC